MQLHISPWILYTAAFSEMSPSLRWPISASLTDSCCLTDTYCERPPLADLLPRRIISSVWPTSLQPEVLRNRAVFFPWFSVSLRVVGFVLECWRFRQLGKLNIQMGARNLKSLITFLTELWRSHSAPRSTSWCTEGKYWHTLLHRLYSCIQSGSFSKSFASNFTFIRLFSIKVTYLERQSTALIPPGIFMLSISMLLQPSRCTGTAVTCLNYANWIHQTPN